MTPRQARFVAEYIKDMNATQAAIRAGYSPKTAQEQGSRLLSKVMVRSATEEGLETVEAQSRLSASLVRETILKMITFDAREAFHPNGKIKTWAEMPDSVRIGVARLKQPRRGGPPTGIIFIDRLRMIELAAKLLGLF